MSTQQPCRGLAGPLQVCTLESWSEDTQEYGLLQFKCSRAHAHAPAVHSQHASWQPRTCQVGIAVQPELVELREGASHAPLWGNGGHQLSIRNAHPGQVFQAGAPGCR